MGYEALVEGRQCHVRLLEISPVAILDLLKIDASKRITINGRELTCVSGGIPQKATVASCGINERGNVLLHVADETFAPVSPGSLIPRIEPVYRLAEQDDGLYEARAEVERLEEENASLMAKVKAMTLQLETLPPD